MISALATHLWQSTLFAIAAGLLTLAFRKNRAQVRFSLWLCASLKFFVPFALLMSLGSGIQWTPAAHEIASQYATPAVAFAVEYVAEPFTAPPAAPSVDWTFAAFLSLWMCGFLAIASIRLRLWLRVRTAVRAGTRLDIPSPVGIRSAPGLLEPGVVGLLHPILLLPEGITERLAPAELEAVIAHELSHVRRRDNLFAAMHMGVETVFWFHPLVWWIGARMVEERERACDEAVLNLGNQPRVYADAIVSVCRLYAESPLRCVSGVTGSNIRRRIEAIMMNRRGQSLNRGRKALLAVAGSLALAGPIIVGALIGFGHLPEIHAQSPVVVPAAPSVAVPSFIVQTPPPARVPQTAAATPQLIPPGGPERRLIAMFFDFTAMPEVDQLRAKEAARSFVQKQMKPQDLMCVFLSNTGPPTVVQDFTADTATLQAVIQKVPVGAGKDIVPGSVAASNSRLASLETVAKILKGFPEKKQLFYFSNQLFLATTDNGAALQSAIRAAVDAGVSFYPIDAGALTQDPVK